MLWFLLAAPTANQEQWVVGRFNYSTQAWSNSTLQTRICSLWMAVMTKYADKDWGVYANLLQIQFQIRPASPLDHQQLKLCASPS